MVISVGALALGPSLKRFHPCRSNNKQHQGCLPWLRRRRRPRRRRPRRRSRNDSRRNAASQLGIALSLTSAKRRKRCFAWAAGPKFGRSDFAADYSWRVMRLAVEDIDRALPDVAHRGRLGGLDRQMRHQRAAHAPVRGNDGIVLQRLVPFAHPHAELRVALAGVMSMARRDASCRRCDSRRRHDGFRRSRRATGRTGDRRRSRRPPRSSPFRRSGDCIRSISGCSGNRRCRTRRAS
jgi:hypothetical protein